MPTSPSQTKLPPRWLTVIIRPVVDHRSEYRGIRVLLLAYHGRNRWEGTTCKLWDGRDDNNPKPL